MALHKESYGLIYNDDGSLCVTLRKDDVPFEGVTSFAVESSTTNMFSNPIFASGTESGFDYVIGWSSRTIKDGGPLGKYIELVDDSTSVACIYGNTFNITAEQTYTFSVYINVLEWNQDGSVDLYYHWLDANNNLISAQTSGTLGEEIPRNFVGQGWRRYKITATAPANAAKVRAFVYSSKAATSRIQVTGFQFEQKPFATSFVDGTRPAGILKIPGVRDFTSKVVTAWFKINYVRNYPRIFDMSDGSTDVTKGWAFYYDHVARDFRFVVGSTIATRTYSNPTNKWFYVVLIFNNGTYAVKLFDDSGLIWDYSFTATMPDLTNNIFKIGNVDSSGGYARPLNGYVSNLLIANYNPAIWTAEHIQELYNMRRPFSVPPRMPII